MADQLDKERYMDNTPSLGPAGSVADRIADRILRAATGAKATRVQLMAGQYPDGERKVGGLCESALAREIQRELFALDECPRCAALRDTIEALKDFVDGKRHDAENIAEIINGALCIPPNDRNCSRITKPR